MKSLVYTGPRKMRIEQRNEPQAQIDEAIVEITASGICGSDIEGYLGKTGRRIAPMVMGHEFAGEIQVAAKNGKLQKNTKVVVFPKLYCGVCSQCKAGKQNVCENADTFGVLSRDGAFVERMAINEKYLIPVDNNLDDIELSLTEPLAVANHAAMKIVAKDYPSDDFLLVVGAGTIGLFILQILKAHGYKKVFVADLSEARLKIAENLGGIPINPKQVGIKEYITTVTKGKMITCSLEAVGAEKTAEMSLDVLHQEGYAVWVGNAAKFIQMNMQKIVTGELQVSGSYLYTLEDFKESIRLLKNKLIDCRALISEVISLDKGPEYFEKLANNKDGKLLKVVIDPRK